jgi:hypothetical protein
MAVSSKVLALGTHWGMVYILDYNGNKISSFESHSATVNEICIDDSGEFLASAGDDGKVVICGLYKKEVTEHQFGRPVLSVALEPRYAKSKSRMFVSGGRAGQLILSKKGFLGVGMKNVVLAARDEGAIRAIAWRGRFIAWTNDHAIKVHDIEAEEAITRIERPPGSWRPDLFSSNLFWASDRTLVIGWANMIKIGQIMLREKPAPGEPAHVVHVSTIALDCVVCGMAPFGQYLTVLAYEQDEEEEAGAAAGGEAMASRPELKVIDPAPGQEDFVDLSSDTLPIEGYERYKPTDYRLHALGSEALYYIVSPKDIVVATPRDLDDHISWLLDRQRYEVAYNDAARNPEQLKKHPLVEIGEAYLMYLLQTDPNACAANCGRVLKNNAQLWEKWIYRFVKKLHVSSIAGYIPIANPQLPKLVYEIVLNNFLQYDHNRFLHTIREWPPSLYDVETVINAVLDQLKNTDENTDVLNNALAELYTFAGQFDKSLHIYLRLKRGNPFQLIEKYKLFSNIRDKVELLIGFDAGRAVDLLLNHTAEISVASVVEQLKESRMLQHQYLDALWRRNPNAGVEFHELQISLYADFDYPRLMSFLRTAKTQPEVALEVCRSRNLYPEMVYILGNTGARKEALKMLIEKMQSVAGAIEFIQTHDPKDGELWEFLISECLLFPDRISELLEHVGGAEHVEPIKLIKRIPEGVEIPHLRDRLVKIISDYGLVQSLREGCSTILESDCVELEERLYAANRRGVFVSNASVCVQCRVPVVINDGIKKSASDSVIVFGCSHVFHMRCLAAATKGILDEGADPVANLKSLMTRDSLKRQTDYSCSICYRQGGKKRTTKRAADFERN